MTRLTILLLAAMVAGGVAQAQITVTNVFVPQPTMRPSIQHNIDYIKRLRSQPNTAQYVGAALDVLVETVEALAARVDAFTNHAPTVVTTNYWNGFRDGYAAHQRETTNGIVTVVTNYATITQECTRRHCDEPRNQWLGDGKIVTNDVGVEK